MKKLKVFLPIALAVTLMFCGYSRPVSADEDYIKEDLEELKERMDQVERKTLMDKISIGAEVRARYDAFTYEDNDLEIDDTVHGIGSTRVRLNLFAKASERMQFHARMGIHNNWNDQDETANLATVASSSRLRTDNTMKVERAYADYFFESLPIVFTIGRVPATDGLPTNFRENTPRKSTYPAMTYDIEADGAGITFLLDKLTGMPGAALRILVTEVVYDDDDEIFRNDTIEMNSEEIYLAQFETGLPWDVLDGIMIIGNWLCMPEISPQASSLIKTEAGLPDQVTLDFSALPGMGALASGGIYDCDTSFESVTKDIGRLDKYTLFVQSEQFLKSWVDWFIGYSILKTDATDKPMYEFSADTSAAEADAQSIFYPPGTIGNKTVLQEMNIVGLLTDEAGSDRDGHCFYAGTRINIPCGFLNKPKIGIEFNRGSKYWVGFGYASEDPLSKMDVRGEVWDFYYIQPVEDGFSFRIGFTTMDVEYDSSTLYYSTPVAVDKEITNTYVLADMKF